MSESVPSGVAAALSRAQREFERWRQRRRPRERIPEELWRQAAELACACGVNRTARALRLDYNALKKHLPAATGSGRRTAEFVEILPGAMPAGRPECLIEVEDAGGAKMRVHVQGRSLPDLGALLDVFRRGRP